MKKIAITMGDPAGIGAEIILKALQKVDCKGLLLIGNSEIFEKNEKLLGLKLPNNLEFLNIDYDSSKISPAIESKYGGELSYLCLKKACDMANTGEIGAIATAPLSKNALHLAGYNYSGQTEILQENLSKDDDKAQMLFVADKLKVLLLTRHVALRQVPKYVTKQNIVETLRIFDKELKEKFKIKTPSIAMCALNPHAGENGILGEEEITEINPAIELLQQEGVNMKGAYSADTLLSKAVKNYQNPDFDAYVACYHDQGLCAIKSLGLENVLNITIGLKVLRSSPSHGTGFDIAYKNLANYESMLNSILFLRGLQ